MGQDADDPRRAKILGAARTVFLSRGFTRAKVEDVARAARVANATAYDCFETKERLFEAVTDIALAPYEGLFDEIERLEGGDCEDILVRYCQVYFRFMADPEVRAIYRIVSAEAAHKPELGSVLYGSAHRLLGQVLQRLLRRFAATGQLAIDDVPVAARLLEGMIEHATLTISMLQGNDAPPLHPAGAYVPEAVRVFLAGYRDRGGVSGT